MSGEVKTTIGGHLTLCGGTRTAVKTVRPWQPKLVFPSREECPFCSKQQEDEFFPMKGWKTFRNSNTPFPFHRLLVPLDECWPEYKLRSLGGPVGLTKILQLALEEVKRTRGSIYPVWIYTHIGYLAGQNTLHHHWHLCAPPTEPCGLKVGEVEFLWESGLFSTFLAGVRAGQAIILPRAPGLAEQLLVNDGAREELADAAYELVETYNLKFHSPDYCLFFGFHSPEEWYVRYTPVLNNWGGSEYAALDYGTPFVLPWPHSETAKFLRGE